jgi:DNA-directed RNA polymerase subunit beta'
MAYHIARKDKELLEAAERQAARALANPFEDAPAETVETHEGQTPDETAAGATE